MDDEFQKDKRDRGKRKKVTKIDNFKEYRANYGIDKVARVTKDKNNKGKNCNSYKMTKVVKFGLHCGTSTSGTRKGHRTKYKRSNREKETK